MKLNFWLKGVSYKEYHERKNGKSYKAKLQYTIDSAIKSAKDWEDFLKILQNSGYEIKYGKHISFRAIDQERFTRSKTIGEDYTEDQIKKRINIKGKNLKKNHLKRARSSNEVVDISSNNLAKQSAGFARWLKLQNLKNMAKSWNEISGSNISDIDTFNEYINQKHDELGHTQNQIKQIESEIYILSQNLKYLSIYKKYKSIYAGYQRSTNKDAYFQIHESKIILFESAKEILNKQTLPIGLSSVSKGKEKLTALNLKSIDLNQKLAKQQDTISNINQLRSNLETYMKSANRENNEKIH